MTIITRENPTDLVLRPVAPARGVNGAGAARRPQRRRPAGAPLRQHGTGVLMSRASHRRRPITPLATVLLALVAAAITLWLGLVAQMGAPVDAPTAELGQLAVVQVHLGETLQQLAQRVAPDAPVAAVVDQIRELNELDSAAVDAGQTLIAPIA